MHVLGEFMCVRQALASSFFGRPQTVQGGRGVHYDKVHGEDVSVCKLLAVLLWLLRQRVSKTRDQSQHSARYTLVVGQPQDEQTADTNMH